MTNVRHPSDFERASPRIRWPLAMSTLFLAAGCNLRIRQVRTLGVMNALCCLSSVPAIFQREE
jgi:hypothetical protein